MKVVFAVALLAVVLAVSSAKSCTDPSDCAAKECCTGFMPFRGTCKGMSKAGGKCLVDEAVFPFNDIYIVACPCAEGLECVAKVSSKGKVKNDGTCQIPEPETTLEPEVASTAAPDNSGSSEEKVSPDQSGEQTEEPEQPGSNEQSGSNEQPGSSEQTQE